MLTLHFWPKPGGVDSGRNAGFILGPAAFALLSFSVRQGQDVSPLSMMSWCFMGLALLQALEA